MKTISTVLFAMTLTGCGCFDRAIWQDTGSDKGAIYYSIGCITENSATYGDLMIRSRKADFTDFTHCRSVGPSLLNGVEKGKIILSDQIIGMSLFSATAGSEVEVAIFRPLDFK